MKIITVIGKPNTGKTTLITGVFEKLKAGGAKVTYFKSLGSNNKDFEAFLFHGDLKIAFYSIGDKADPSHSPMEYVANGITYGYNSGADIFINAFSNSILSISEKEYLSFIGQKDKCIFIRMNSQTASDIDKQHNEKMQEVIEEINRCN